MAVIIDHEKNKISDALGLKKDFVENVDQIIKDYFVNAAGDGKGHGKASQSLVEAVRLAKREVFNDEDQEVQEYEATLVYLAFLVGAEIAAQKSRMSHNPLAHMIGDIIRGREEGVITKRSAPIVMAVDSREEMELHKSVIENMAKGNYIQAMNKMIRLQEIKGKGKKKGKKTKKTTRKTTPKK